MKENCEVNNMSDNSKRVTFSIYDDDIKKLNAWSDKYHVSMSWLIRYLINSNESLDKCNSFLQLTFWKSKE